MKKRLILGGTIACLIFVLPIPIISIMTATEHRDDKCQNMDSIGIDLHEWLLGSGIVFLLTLFVSFASVGMMISCLNESGTGTYIVILGTILFVHDLFGLIYSIIGGIVLYRSSMDCLTDGTALGIMAQIMLGVYWMGIISWVLILMLNPNK